MKMELPVADPLLLTSLAEWIARIRPRRIVVVMGGHEAEVDLALARLEGTPGLEFLRITEGMDSVDEPDGELGQAAERAFAAASACELLIVIGSVGATAIPWHLAIRAREADAAILVIDPQDSPFAVHARNRERVGKGLWLRGPGSAWIPRTVECLLAPHEAPRRPPSVLPAPPQPRVAVSLVATLDDPDARALAELLAHRQPRRVLVLAGAGLSKESGLPTYREAGGLWSARGGMAQSRAEFLAGPRQGWTFMLRRRGQSRAAAPNVAHLALARLERTLGDALCVVTQNIDGLQLRAGSSEARTIELHGNLRQMRALERDDVFVDPHPIDLPDALVLAEDEELSDARWSALAMPDGSPARPHVLLWDEAYNEVQYRSESALAAARSCDLLVTIGTSGVAALPYAIAAEAVLEAHASLVDINVADTPYAEHARALAEHGRGLALRGPASRWVPELVTLLESLHAALSRSGAPAV
jgi:NAD-dependent deacetylase